MAQFMPPAGFQESTKPAFPTSTFSHRSSALLHNTKRRGSHLERWSQTMTRRATVLSVAVALMLSGCVGYYDGGYGYRGGYGYGQFYGRGHGYGNYDGYYRNG